MSFHNKTGQNMKLAGQFLSRQVDDKKQNNSGKMWARAAIITEINGRGKQG